MKIEILLFLCLSLMHIFSEGMSAHTLKAKVISGKSNDVDQIKDSFVYTPDARPFGKSYPEWIQQSWERVYSLRCEDIAGVYQTIELDEHLSLFMCEMVDTILAISWPKEKAIMLRMGGVAVTYPCPDSSFQPVAGQSLETFIHNRVDTIINMININEITLDGKVITNMQDFRFVSNLFNITGNTELAGCFDECITGNPQPCVTGGYCIIFKEMSPGKHTLNRGGEIPSIGLKWHQTIHLIVE